MSMAITFDDYTPGSLMTVTADWVSDTSGAASWTSERIIGRLVRIATRPDTSAVPTDNYDIVITDDLGFNVLTNVPTAGTLANRDTTGIEQVYPLINSVGSSGAPQPVA